MTSRSVLRVLGALVAAAVLLAVLAFAWLRLAPRHVPSGQPPLSTLDERSLPAFRDAFNASKGEVRVLALLSPT